MIASALLAALLVGWFLLVVGVDPGVGSETLLYWFTTTSLSHPTPGLVLGALTHASVTHLANNVAGVVVYGGLAEQHGSSRSVAALFVVAAVTGNVVQEFHNELVGLDMALTGASAGVMALGIYYAFHYFGEHDADLFHVATPMQSLASVMAVLAVLHSGFQLLNDFTPLLSLAPHAAGYSHLTGLVLGVCWYYLQPVLSDPSCR